MLVSDIQGVEDLYTDPQMISVDKRFGERAAWACPPSKCPVFYLDPSTFGPKECTGRGRV